MKSIEINYENITINNLSYYLYGLTQKEQEEIFENPKVIKIFQDYLIEEASYSHYNQLFEKYDPNLLKNVFTDEFIDEYKYEINEYQNYILFASMFTNTKDTNSLMDNILESDKLFDFFSEEYEKLYSAVSMDLKHYKKLIEKIEEKNYYDKYKYMNINGEELEKEILNEHYSQNTLCWLITTMSMKTKKDFYKNDPRAIQTLPTIKRYISSYLDNDMEFSSEIIKDPKFFEILKTPSILDFRKRINLLEDNNKYPYYIESQVKKYYEDLLSTYNQETKLFTCYEEILDDQDKYYEYLRDHDNYLTGGATVIRENRRDKEKYIKTTNKKVSEIVVDYLFQDNIYNVWHNINQMINYISKLDEKISPVSKENLMFYKNILQIDKQSPEEKIDMLNKLKEKDINTMFYEDLRNTKDLAYKNIKENLIDPIDMKYEKIELTEKYAVPTYDLRDEEYFMLVRTLHSNYHEDYATRAASSYSLISNENTALFEEERSITYGYSSFDIDRVMHMFDFDSFSSAYATSIGGSKEATYHVNQISTPEEIANTSGYSEILLKNETKENGKFNEIKPNFIVVKEEPKEKDIEAAKQLNVPIVIIKEQLSKNGGIHFITDKTENYTQGSYEEDKRNEKRH